MNTKKIVETWIKIYPGLALIGLRTTGRWLKAKLTIIQGTRDKNLTRDKV